MPRYQETVRRAELPASTRVVKSTPIFEQSSTKRGQLNRVGTEIKTADGKIKTLLTPAGKGAKYADELKSNCRITNDGQVKTNSCGCVQELTSEQKAWRGGYLAAQKDSAKCHNASQGKSGGKRK